VAKGNGAAIITASIGGRSDTTTVTVFTAKALAITPVRPMLTAIGDSAPLVAVPTDASGGTVQDVSATWESSATAVATVDRGVIVAKGNGTASITARAGTLVDTTTVTVTQKPAQLTFLTRPASQLQGHVLAAAVEVAVADSRGVRLAIPSAPIQLSIADGTLGGTTSRSAAAGVAAFDDLVPSEPARATHLTASLGTLQASSVLFEVQLALASVSAGGGHTCGLTAAGHAYCWGYPGRTGDGSSVSRTTPVRVSGSDSYRSLDAGSSFTTAFTTADVFVTWESAPAPFSSAQTFTSVSAGWFSCGITASQVAYCWGTAPAYFGNDTVTNGAMVATPTLAMGGRKLLAIVPGMAHTCAIMAADSTAWCAGNNPNGELGNGTTSFSSAPVAVAGGFKFRSLSLGNEFSCGITVSGETYCWGRNESGQLGDPAESGTHSALPRLVARGHVFRTISAGGTTACGVGDDGIAYCWGNNSYGLLGSGNTSGGFSATPVAVTGGLKFDVVSVGGWHACGVAKTGYTYCWGDWSNGATGTGSANTNNGPAVIASPSP
jgi:alpha-tubulin suppressor-like RCC1 family protein